VRVSVRNGAGEQRPIRARYLIAADEAHSAVRRMLDVPMQGTGAALGGVQVVLRAPLGKLVGSPQYVLYSVTTPDAVGSFLSARPGDRWVHGWSSGPDADYELAPQRVIERIRCGAGVADLEPVIDHIGRFRSPAELAERFRVGNGSSSATPRIA
jgi:2-polyprenyl-6-methoxyphenol hydroxylase-like FAD-dependent oxidoreductase